MLGWYELKTWGSYSRRRHEKHGTEKWKINTKLPTGKREAKEVCLLVFFKCK